MLLKIGRHEYEITSSDIFIDNGACVLLMTQSKDWRRRGRYYIRPVLSKRAIKQINEFEHIPRKHSMYGRTDTIKVFSLKI